MFLVLIQKEINFYQYIQFEILRQRYTNLTVWFGTANFRTAIGIDQKEYSRAKLKLIGNRFQEEIIHNMSIIGLKNIGTEKNNTEVYIDKLCELFGFNKAFKDHFQSQVAKGLQKIYAIIGQRSCSQLLVDLTAEQLGTRHPWLSPNVKIYANPLTNQILMAGQVSL